MTNQALTVDPDVGNASTVTGTKDADGVYEVDTANGLELLGTFHRTCTKLWRALWRVSRSLLASLSSKQSTKFKSALESFHSFGNFLDSTAMSEVHEQFYDLWANVLELLCDTGKSLESLSAKLARRLQHDKVKENLDDLLLDLRTQLESAQFLLGNQPEDTEYISESVISDTVADEDGYDNILLNLGTCSTCLMDLGPTIESAMLELDVPVESQAKTVPVQFQISDPAQAFISLLLDRYPNADAKIIQRLGEANWQRSVRIRNLAQHHDILNESHRSQLLQSGAKSVFAPTSAFHDSGLGTSVAATLVYEPSLVSDYSEHGGASARVPPTPNEAMTGDPFVCSICGKVQSGITSRQMWKAHVFKDLQPYLCTHQDCHDEYVVFPTRQLWVEHEFSKHRTSKSYTCLVCQRSYVEIETLQRHLQLDHMVTTVPPTPLLLNLALESSLQSVEHDLEEERCRLCRRSVGKSRQAFASHWGRHMESIALATLPRDVDEDKSEDSEGSVSLDDTTEYATIQAPERQSEEDRRRATTPYFHSDRDYMLSRSYRQASEQPSTALPSANVDFNGSGAKRGQKHPSTYHCTLCTSSFTRAYSLRSHLRTHTDERPFVCTVCGKAFARQHDRKRHESLHSGEKRFICRGTLGAGVQWGCGRGFAKADALGRHFRSEAGKTCIKPLLEEEAREREAAMMEAQSTLQSTPKGMAGPLDVAAMPLPTALLQMYPGLADIPWNSMPATINEGDWSGIYDSDYESGGRNILNASRSREPENNDEEDDDGFIGVTSTAPTVPTS